MKGRKYTRRWQPRSGAAHATELIQVRPERRTCRIESVQSLYKLQSVAKKRGMVTYLVQIVDESNQIVTLNV